jgi:hypothetical protein
MRNFRFEANAYSKMTNGQKRKYQNATKQGYSDRQATGIAKGYYRR